MNDACHLVTVTGRARRRPPRDGVLGEQSGALHAPFHGRQRIVAAFEGRAGASGSGRPRRTPRGRGVATSACNNEISREQEPIDARNLTRRLTSRLLRIERLRVRLLTIAG